jgi:hypothetical protein
LIINKGICGWNFFNRYKTKQISIYWHGVRSKNFKW